MKLVFFFVFFYPLFMSIFWMMGSVIFFFRRERPERAKEQHGSYARCRGSRVSLVEGVALSGRLIAGGKSGGEGEWYPGWGASLAALSVSRLFHGNPLEPIEGE